MKTHTVTGRSQKQATSASHFTAVLPHRGFLHSYKQFNRILYEESTLVLLLHWTQTCELSERIRPTPLWPQLLVLLGVDSWGCRQPPCVRLQEECPNWPEEKFHWFKKKKERKRGNFKTETNSKSFLNDCNVKCNILHYTFVTKLQVIKSIMELYECIYMKLNGTGYMVTYM